MNSNLKYFCQCQSCTAPWYSYKKILSYGCLKSENPDQKVLDKTVMYVQNLDSENIDVSLLV